MNEPITITSKPRLSTRRHNLKKLLPDVVHRIHRGTFATQEQIAREYGIDKSSATRWKQLAVEWGLTDAKAWQCGLIMGRMSQTLTIRTTPNDPMQSSPLPRR